MTDNEVESGFELVLDNRRLIATFAVFIVICGSFFVLGYSTGKRQGEIAAAGAFVRTTDAGGTILEGSPIEELEWYQSVNSGGDQPAGVAPPRPLTDGSVMYSVQVGAFKTRQQADSHAKDVLDKGFESRVEAPSDSDQLFLVKVGRFNTRDEAMAIQLSLEKNGYNTLIKSN